MPSIANLTQEQLSHIQFGKAPPGLTEKQLNGSYNAVACTTILSVILLVAVFLYSLRMYTKIRIQKQLKWDDLACTLGLISTISSTIAFAIACNAGPLGKHAWNVTLADVYTHHFAVAEWILQCFGATTLGLIKLAIFLFYLDLFGKLKWVRWTVYIGASLSSAFYLAITIVNFYYFSPRKGESFASHFTNPMTTQVEKLGIPTSAVGLAIDILLLIIPIRAVLQLQMIREKRIRLLLIFTVGVGAVMGGLLSLAFKIKCYHKPDLWYNLFMVNFFVGLEMALGICIASTPFVPAALRHMEPKLAYSMNTASTSLRKLQYLKGRLSSAQRDDSSDPEASHPSLNLDSPVQEKSRSFGGDNQQEKHPQPWMRERETSSSSFSSNQNVEAAVVTEFPLREHEDQRFGRAY